MEIEFIETSLILMQPDQTSGDKLCSQYYFKTRLFFFSQKAVTLGIGNHKRDTAEWELSPQNCSKDSPSTWVHAWSNREQKQKCSVTFVRSTANTGITKVTKSGGHALEVAGIRT